MTLRSVLAWTGRALAAAATVALLAWAAHRFNRSEPISIRGAATLIGLAVLPLYVYSAWTSYTREWLIDRADETLDAVDQAHERIDTLGERQDITHRMVTGTAQPAQPLTEPIRMPTVERPAIDLAGGARLNGATASGRGRHAAPETEAS